MTEPNRANQLRLVTGKNEKEVYDFPIFSMVFAAVMPPLVRAIFICYYVVYPDDEYRSRLGVNKSYDEIFEGRSFSMENLQINVSKNNGNFMQNYLTRSLQQTQCNMNVTTVGNEVVLDPPDSTWSSIALTFYIAGSIGLAVLVLYELFRRDPIIGKYVYDRKRLVQPDRTPPPLMLSRSLWQGYDNDNQATDSNGGSKRQNSTCWKVRPALLEIFFLNLNESYVRYSQAADNARREREKRGIYSCCRSGCYHDNCCNRTHRRKQRNNGKDQNGDEFVDEDGYVFYPGYNYSNSYAESDSDNKQDRSLATNVDGNNQGNGVATAQALGQRESQQPTHSTKMHASIRDLFPEDFRSCLPETKATADGSIGRLGSILARNELSIGGGQITNPRDKSIEIESNHEIVSPNTQTVNAGEDEDWVGRISMIGKNSKGVQIGTLEATGETQDNNSVMPSSFEELHDFTLPTVGEVEWKNLKVDCCSNSESDTSSKAKQSLCLEDGLADEDLTVDEEKSASRPPLKYPNRFQSYFLPPGFHNWSDVWKYLGYLLFIPRCRRECKDSNPVFTPSSPTNQSSLPSQSPRNNGSYPQLKIRAQEIPLTSPERELLRCAGLDTYLMIRFARFGFDVTFYPFAVACVTVLPVYIFNSHDSWKHEGFFSLTINRIEANDPIMWVVVVFTVLLYLFVLRRLWMEWEVVIKLRHHFLENGDENFHKSSIYLKKFRNTCIVECVPKRHRSDRSLQNIFERLFPGQIKNAEMVIDTSTLDKILDKRREFLDKYESIVARYRYEKWTYDHGSSYCCVTTSEPIEPQVRTGGSFFKGTKENAIKHYKTMVDKLKVLAHEEYDKIVEKRLQIRNAGSLSQSTGSVDHHDNFDIYSVFLPSLVQEALGLNVPEFFCGTGFVEFKSLSAKQSAVQCNLSGESNWMITRDAPDPRDILWSNICTEHTKIETRKIVTQFFLLIGILVWGTFVTIVTNAANKSIDNIKKADPFQDVDESNSNLVVVLRGYIPPLLVSLILLWLPQVFFILAIRVIRFKSLSQVDEFVMKWNTGYRLANIFFIFFSISLIDAFRCFKDDPELFIKLVAEGILRQSTFLVNLVLISTGQETMLQLLQWRSLIKQALYRPLVNLNKRSRRYLDRLNEAPDFEKAFIFGFFAPTLSYGLMVAMMYSYMAPIVLGVCSFFFWVASKVHTHNALYIYVQPFEGGGKIFYYWNRIVFTTLYSSIVIFSGVLALKKFPQMSVSFLIIMILVTFVVDKSIENTFVSHSLNLPMTIARINDEEEAALIQKSERKSDGGENFIYRHPMLNQANWDKRPFWWG